MVVKGLNKDFEGTCLEVLVVKTGVLPSRAGDAFQLRGCKFNSWSRAKIPHAWCPKKQNTEALFKQIQLTL